LDVLVHPGISAVEKLLPYVTHMLRAIGYIFAVPGR
jgi:hypothetical protein